MLTCHTSATLTVQNIVDSWKQIRKLQHHSYIKLNKAQLNTRYRYKDYLDLITISDIWHSVNNAGFCASFLRYRMRDRLFNNVKFHWGALGHSCPDLDDVISMSCIQCTPLVKAIRRNGRLWCSRHIDVLAPSKRDKNTWKTKTKKEH